MKSSSCEERKDTTGTLSARSASHLTSGSGLHLLIRSVLTQRSHTEQLWKLQKADVRKCRTA